MLQQRAELMTAVNTAVLTAASFIPAFTVAYIDYMTSRNPARGNVRALIALAARLAPGLTWKPVPGPGLLIENGIPSMATVVTLVDDKYAAEVEQEWPPEPVGPVTDPDGAATNVSKMLAPTDPEGFYRDDLRNVEAGTLKVMAVW